LGVGASTKERVGRERDILRLRGGAFGVGWVIQVQHNIVREAGGEDQRRTLNWQHDSGLLQARDHLGIGRTQRRGDRLLDGWQANDDHRLGVVERRRRVQAQVERLLLR
jgi:hypothetical protein